MLSRCVLLLPRKFITMPCWINVLESMFIEVLV